MNYKKLGFLIIAISIFLSFMIISFIVQINKEHEENCVCSIPNNMMDDVFQSYIGVSVILILFLVGFFLVLNEKKEKIKYEQEKKFDKHKTLLNYLNDDERKVFDAVSEQPGITQATLKLRVGFSKSKLSSVIIDLEKRNIFAREIKGKTYKIFLK